MTSKSSVIRPSTRVRSAAICLSFFLLCRQAGPLNSKRLRLFENATAGKWGTLFFGGRKYGDYNLSSHGNQRIQADAWGVNPGVGWYVTTPNPFSPNGRQIQAAGPIYNTEGGSEAGFNTVELDGPNPSPTPTPGPSASPANKP